MAGVDVEGYGGLFLTEAARPVLRGEANVHLREFQPKTTERSRNKRRNGQTNFNGTDQILWEKLRAKRQDIAQAQDIPPYVIFHDSTLADMVCHCPITLEDFASISGVGKRKLDQYGQSFIEVIENHLIEHDLQPKPQTIIEAPQLSETAQRTISLLKQGHALEHIAEQRSLKVSTIYTHLAQAIEVDQLNITDVPGVFDTDLDIIGDALSELPPTETFALKPLYEQLEGAYDYGILRCITTHLLK